MQIGEVPLRSCISYRNGPNCDCLLSCFDANKKIIFIKHNGKIVFRAILRLTKGSFVAADERKTIEFVDVTVKSEPHENKAEELVLFLERYYQSGLNKQQIRKAVNLTAMLVKEKAEKLGARLVLSSSYKNVLENKNYVLTNFYMYISASKMEASIWTALEGPLVSVLPEAIPAIHFCWKQKRGEKRAYEYTKSRKKSSKKST